MAASPADMPHDPIPISDHGHQDVREILRELREDIPITPETVEKLRCHTANQGRNICRLYHKLNAILLRHEQLIRTRWTKKTVAQRRKILLKSWPWPIPQEHRPDDEFRYRHHTGPNNGFRPIAALFPFINQEDLTKPKPLLVFLNARGRNTPWTFILTEMEFCTADFMLPCTDEDLCRTMTIEFTKTPDPRTYGKINVGKAPGTPYTRTEYMVDYCARQSLQLLFMQELILWFLVDCSISILHDMNGVEILAAPIKDEPPTAELLEPAYNEHTTFAHVLLMTPYQSRSSFNISRLRGFVEGVLNTHKEHVCLLREDPGYFADVVQERFEHSKWLVTDVSGNRSSFAGSELHKAHIVFALIDESLFMFAHWREAHERIKSFEAMSHQILDIHHQAHHISELKLLTYTIAANLMCKIRESFLGAPEIRKLLSSDSSGSVYTRTKGIKSSQRDVLEALEIFEDANCKAMIGDPAYMSFALDSTDRFFQSSLTARSMLTSRLLSLLSDLSVAAECLRMVSLWEQAPEVQAVMHKHGSCNYKLQSNLDDFYKWICAIDENCKFPLSHIFPLREKLIYPAHKEHTQEHVAAMRSSEQNLDYFWMMVDRRFESKTGKARHEILQECLNEYGPMTRTAPWVDISGKKQERFDGGKPAALTEFEMAHNISLQFTGSFDRLSVAEKVKAKTRGDAKPSTHRTADQAKHTHLNSTERSFTVNKATYKVMKTLFHVPTHEASNLPTNIKWNDFTRAMINIGFAAEKLQGSAWQFTPKGDVGAGRSIQFHEPHPDSNIPFVMAKRFGRRLFRVYGWHWGLFRLS
ncbi:hypothetical protein OPT61_g5657 [Boeremia exigua]|uniref:Uncharacterized protein n=1 Tax=Boeremia exigua TaxID=749465 RepID=A0ACC2I9N1_9PLEO|nr:hypothetical protein OPT61_g5657 [Boeremia exigua]